MFVGVDNVARKLKSAYVGIDGVSRKIKAVYVGVNGVARLVWQLTRALTRLSRYPLATKTGEVLTHTLNGSGNPSSSVNMLTAIPSKNDPKALYSVLSANFMDLNNQQDVYRFVLKITLDDNNNISDLKKVGIGSGFSWTDSSGNYGYNFDYDSVIFEMGKYVFVGCYNEQRNSGVTETKPYYLIADIATETTLYLSGQYECNTIIGGGAGFNDNTAVIAYDSSEGIIGLLKFDGTNTTIQSYHLSVNGQPLRISSPEYKNSFTIFKLGSHKGYIYGNAHYVDSITYDVIHGTFIIPFSLNEDYSALNIGTPILVPEVDGYTPTLNRPYMYDNNTIICSYVGSNDSTVNKKMVYIDSMTIDDNLNISFKHLYKTPNLYDSDIYSGSSHCIRVGESNSFLVPCSVYSNISANYSYYRFDIESDDSVTYKGVISPETDQTGDVNTNMNSFGVPLLDGRIVNVEAVSEQYVGGTYNHNIYVRAKMSVFE